MFSDHVFWCCWTRINQHTSLSAYQQGSEAMDMCNEHNHPPDQASNKAEKLVSSMAEEEIYWWISALFEQFKDGPGNTALMIF